MEVSGDADDTILFRRAKLAQIRMFLLITFLILVIN